MDDKCDITQEVEPDNSPSESIVIICEDDGQTWADFFKVKLTEKDYSFNTWIQSFSECDSSVVSEMSKLQVALISPELLDNTANLEKLLIFSADSCVFILLGVDQNDVRKAFEKDCDDILGKYSYHVIEEGDTNQSLTNALVKIIECYEADFYEYLPKIKPVKVNKLIDVFPSNVLTGGSDIYLLLEKKAEETVNIVIDKSGGKTIPAQHTNTAIYRVTLPEETSGYVSFRVESDHKMLGQHEAHATSKLEQLNSLILDTTDPLAIMCQSLGIPRTSAALDKKLAEQVKNNWSTHTIPVIMQMFESLDHTDETSTEMWPTVLHFAAEYNLELFCTELLKYPGMVNIAVISNVNGQYPCEIAKEKGFMNLSQQLYSIVEKHSSGRLSDCLDPLPPPPPPCSGPHYVNDPSSVENKNNGSYINMKNPKTSAGSSLHHSVSEPSCKTLPSQEGDNSDSEDNEYDIIPEKSVIQVRVQCVSKDDTYMPVKPKPLSEVIAETSPKHGGSLFQKHHISDSSDYRPLGVKKELLTPSLPFPKIRSLSIGAGQSLAQLKQFQQQLEQCEIGGTDPVFEQNKVLLPLREPKKRSKFSKFLNKFRKSHDESSVASRADHSKHASKHLSKTTGHEKKHSVSAELERDSGSYSDDESAGVNYKQTGKSDTMLQPPSRLARTKSIRVAKALQEKMDNAPTLPSRTYRDSK